MTVRRKVVTAKGNGTVRAVAATVPARSAANGRPLQNAARVEAANEPHSRLGLRLRQARIAKAMRLQDLARVADCSTSLLSKIENSRANPSINLLHRLANALGTNLAWLLAPARSEDDDVVLRKDHRPTLNGSGLDAAEGITLQALFPQGQGHLLQGQIHIIQPGARSDGAITHEGEELGLVLVGTLDLMVNGKTYQLVAGDSFHFDSSLPHAYGNSGDEVTHVAWVNTPPTY